MAILGPCRGRKCPECRVIIGCDFASQDVVDCVNHQACRCIILVCNGPGRQNILGGNDGFRRFSADGCLAVIRSAIIRILNTGSLRSLSVKRHGIHPEGNRELKHPLGSRCILTGDIVAIRIVKTSIGQQAGKVKYFFRSRIRFKDIGYTI